MPLCRRRRHSLRDIIGLIGQGLSNRDIGNRLVAARSQAAVHAIRNGLA